MSSRGIAKVGICGLPQSVAARNRLAWSPDASGPSSRPSIERLRSARYQVLVFKLIRFMTQEQNTCQSVRTAAQSTFSTRTSATGSVPNVTAQESTQIWLQWFSGMGSALNAVEVAYVRLVTELERNEIEGTPSISHYRPMRATKRSITLLYTLSVNVQKSNSSNSGATNFFTRRSRFDSTSIIRNDCVCSASLSNAT